MPLIKCEGLSFSYGAVEALHNINFQVSAGDYLCIVGKNGSGKSTLVKLMLQLLTPGSGRVSLGDGLRYGEAGYLPQAIGERKMFPASVWEVVMSGCLNGSAVRPYYTRAQREKAELHMETLDIAGLRGKMFCQLSGGQQRKVLLARALCAAGRLLLLDEPCAGLDPRAQMDFYETVGRLNGNGTAIVMVTHDLDAVRQNARTVLQIQREQLYFGGVGDYPFDAPDAGLWGRE